MTDKELLKKMKKAKELIKKVDGKNSKRVKMMDNLMKTVKNKEKDMSKCLKKHGGKKRRRKKVSKKVRKKQKLVGKKYKDFKWKREKVVNNCKSDSFKLHATQKFLKNYFNPEKNKKGLLLYHSVGSGKTCAAIAMASNFEDAGYTIIWVTRNSIKNVVYQNLWGEHVCHPKMIENAKRITDSEQKVKTFNAITNRAWLKPVSYRSFSNITKKKSKLYKKLVERNGVKDPLKKTIIIIDEAHNFTTFKPIGFTKHESAKFEDIRDMIHNSYKTSGNDSARVLLLSATPGLNGAIGAINMLNLLEPKSSNRLPTKSDEFIKKFLKSDLSGFNKEGRSEFGRLANKYVSFLDTTKDHTKFAKKVFETYNDPVSRVKEDLQLKLKMKKNESISEKCKKSNLIKQVNNVIKMPGMDTRTKIVAIDNILKHTDIQISDHKALFINIKKLVADCKKKYSKIEDQERCISSIKKNKKDAKDKLKDEIQFEAEKCKAIFKNEKESTIKSIKEKLDKKRLLYEKNQQKALDECLTKPMNKAEKTKCLKSALLWSDKQKMDYRFENKKYNPELINKVLPIVSAKFKKLLDTIKEIDKKDKCVYKKNFKHVIFLDDPKYIKLLMSILLANDFKLALELHKTEGKRKGKTVTHKSLKPIVPKSMPRRTHLSKKTPQPRPHKKNFTVLTKTGIYQRNIGKNLASKIKKQFNERPENIYGKNVRFVILDKTYLEGVSLFDVKYLHILTEPKTKFQQQQLIGRVVRRCGHKGLPMDKGEGGWKLNVMVYQNRDKDKTIVDKVINKLELEKELVNAGERLDAVEEIIVDEMERNALDRKLTSKIHKSLKDLM